MGNHAFEFNLQPALDKAVADRDVAAGNVAELQSQITRARSQLADLQQKHRAAVQLHRTETDNHCTRLATVSDTIDLIDGAQDLLALKKNIVKADAMVIHQQQKIDGLHLQLEDKKQILLRCMEQQKAFEKLRERAAEAHARQLAHAEEMQIDEQALEQFERQRKLRPKG